MWIGLDFGTYKLCSAFWKNGNYHIIPNHDDARITPNNIRIQDGKFSFSTNRTKNSIYSVKRTLGQLYEESGMSQTWPQSAKLSDGTIGVVVDKTYRPEDIIYHILYNMIQNTQQKLQTNIKGIVIAIPDSFTQIQRKQLKNVGASLNIGIRLIHDSTSACLSYQNNIMRLNASYTGNILIYNLGATYTSASIINFDDGLGLVTHSACHDVGADDFDYALCENLAKKYNICSDANIKYLLGNCQKVKHDLSSISNSIIEIDFDGQTEFISSTYFEEVCQRIAHKCFEPVYAILEHIGVDQIDKVIMIGGGSRIKMIRRMMTSVFGNKLEFTLHAEESIAIGACMQAAIYNNDQSLNDNVLPINICAHNISIIHEAQYNTKNIRLAPYHTDMVIPGHHFPNKFTALCPLVAETDYLIIRHGTYHNKYKMSKIKITCKIAANTVKTALITADVDPDGVMVIAICDFVSREAISFEIFE